MSPSKRDAAPSMLCAARPADRVPPRRPCGSECRRAQLASLARITRASLQGSTPSWTSPADKRQAVTRSRLAGRRSPPGVRAGGVTMVHTRMSSLGWIVGGSGSALSGRCSTPSVPTGRSSRTPPGRPRLQRRRGRASIAMLTWRNRRYSTSPRRRVRDHGRDPERVRTWAWRRSSSHPRRTWSRSVHARAGSLIRTGRDAYGARSPPLGWWRPRRRS